MAISEQCGLQLTLGEKMCHASVNMIDWKLPAFLGRKHLLIPRLQLSKIMKQAGPVYRSSKIWCRRRAVMQSGLGIPVRNFTHSIYVGAVRLRLDPFGLTAAVRQQIASHGRRDVFTPPNPSDRLRGPQVRLAVPREPNSPPNSYSPLRFRSR